MIPSRLLGIQVASDGKAGNGFGRGGITSSVSQSISMGNLSYFGTTGPPLQMTVSGWIEGDTNDKHIEITVDEKSKTQEKCLALCSVVIGDVEPPTSSETGSPLLLSGHSGMSSSSDLEQIGKDGTSFLLPNSPLLLTTSTDNLRVVSGMKRGKNLLSSKTRRKSTVSLRCPLIPRPLISQSQSVLNKDFSVRVNSLQIHFERVNRPRAASFQSCQIDPPNLPLSNTSISISRRCVQELTEPESADLSGISIHLKKPDDLKKRQVYLCVIFLKIGEIDTIKEQYAADVLIKAKWRETEMDSSNACEYDWHHSWTPKLYIENTIGETREQLHQMITFNEFGHAFLVEKRRVSGVFLENLELNHFPFDVEDLTITIASNLPSSEIRLVNDPDEPHRINKQSFVDEQEWYLFKHIETEQLQLANEYIENASVRPALSVKCRAARRPAYFLWNIFLVTFLICSLSLVTFTVERSQPQSRLQLAFTLVLTLVAFKFVVNQCLPKISYLTYLDKYIISSLFFLTIICIWHGGISVIERSAQRFNITLWEDMELYVIVIIGTGYFTFNVGFVVMIYAVACKRRRIMKKKDQEYLEKIKCQMKKKSRSHQRNFGNLQSFASPKEATESV